MNRDPSNRRRARAVAVSVAADAQMKAVFAKVLVAFAALFMVIEAVTVAQHLVFAPHP